MGVHSLQCCYYAKMSSWSRKSSSSGYEVGSRNHRLSGYGLWVLEAFNCRVTGRVPEAIELWGQFRTPSGYRASSGSHQLTSFGTGSGRHQLSSYGMGSSGLHHRVMGSVPEAIGLWGQFRKPSSDELRGRFRKAIITPRYVVGPGTHH